MTVKNCENEITRCDISMDNLISDSIMFLIIASSATEDTYIHISSSTFSEFLLSHFTITNLLIYTRNKGSYGAVLRILSMAP